MILSRKYIFTALMIALCMNILQAVNVSLEITGLEHAQSPQGKVLPTLFIGDTFTIKIIIHGDRDTGEIKVQGLDQFKILGQSQSNGIAVINGHPSSEVSILLEVQAEKEGIFALGPATVTHSGSPAKIKCN